MSANHSIITPDSMSAVDSLSGYFAAGYRTALSTFSMSPNRLAEKGIIQHLQLSPLVSFLLIGFITVSVVALSNLAFQMAFMSTFKNWQRPKAQGKWSWIMGNLIRE